MCVCVGVLIPYNFKVFIIGYYNHAIVVKFKKLFQHFEFLLIIQCHSSNIKNPFSVRIRISVGVMPVTAALTCRKLTAPCPLFNHTSRRHPDEQQHQPTPTQEALQTQKACVEQSEKFRT